jgi:hypothetical protein
MDEKKVSKWAPLLEAVGLPTTVSEVTWEMPVKMTSMPVREFQKLISRPGRVPGYYPGMPYGETDIRVCLAGSAVLAWVTYGATKDRDYFPANITHAQRFNDYLLAKGFQCVGYQGERNVMAQFAEGDEWQPDVTDIHDWYVGLLGCSDQVHLPHPVPPTADLPPEELVRALNYRKPGNSFTHQIVLLIRGTPDQVIRTFDFSMCQFALGRDRSGEVRIYWGDHTIQSLVRRRVVVETIHHPLSTMRRMLKYAKRGWYFCSGSMLRIARGLAHFADAREKVGLDPLVNLAFSLD